MMRAPFGIELGYLIAGPSIWFAHYLFIYGMNALRCARAPTALGAQWLLLPVSGWIIVIGSILALIAMYGVTRRQRHRMVKVGGPAFHVVLTRTLCLLSAMAVVWQTLPMFLVSACG